MFTYRVLYNIVLLCSLIFYVVYPLWLSGFLLLLTLLLIPFDLLISLPGMLSGRIEIKAPKMLRQG